MHDRLRLWLEPTLVRVKIALTPRWTAGPSSAILSSRMAYHVVALTMAQVRLGALAFQRQLSAALAESRDLKVYSVSPFALDERRRFKDRFGGDVVYFFNDAARDLLLAYGSDLQFVAEIADSELPQRRTLVVGIPEQESATDSRGSQG